MQAARRTLLQIRFRKSISIFPRPGSEKPRRTLKHDDTFIVVDSYGDIGASGGGVDGLFQRIRASCRGSNFCSMACSRCCSDSNVRDDNSVLTVDLTNPDVYYDQKLVLGKDTLHIVRTLFLWRATAYQRFCIRNHGDKPVALAVSFVFASDFADIFEARGIRRRASRQPAKRRSTAQTVTLNYQGLGRRHRAGPSSIRSRAGGSHQHGRVLDIELEPRERRSIFVAVNCDGAGRDPNACISSGE